MATGILGQAAPAAVTNTTVYTVPAATTATFNINICNTGSSPVNVRVALAATGTPTSSEWVEYGANILAGQVLERTGFVAEATKRVVVYSDIATIAVSVYGYEA